MRAVPPPLPRQGINPLVWVGLSGAIVVFGGVVIALVVQFAMVKGPREELAVSPPIASLDHVDPNPFATAIRPDTATDIAAAGGAEMNPEQVDPTALPDTSGNDVASPPTVDTTSLPEKSSAPAEEPPVFEDLRRRNYELELPGRGLIREATEVKLASLAVPKGQSVQLALTGIGATGLKLAVDKDRTMGTAWTALKQARDAFGGQEEVSLGQFVIQDDELRFQWNPGAAAWAKPGSIQFARLEVTVGTQKQTCQLWRHVVVNPARVNTQSVTNIEIPLPGEFVDRPQSVRIQYQLSGGTLSTLTSNPVGIGDMAKIQIGDAENGIEVELKSTAGDTRSSLQVHLFASAPMVGKDGDVRYVRQEVSPSVVQGHLRQAKARDPKKKEAEVDRLQKQVASFQKQIATREDAMASAALAVRNRLEMEVDALTRQMEGVETKLAKLEGEITASQVHFEKCNTWCESVGQILQELDQSTQLRYAIYLDTVPRTVLVETSDFEWAKE
jgi:hypothetical protein